MDRKSICTSDGVTLSYLEGGEGLPLLMLTGWSQTASIFRRQFDDFGNIARIIALEHRGHGESSKPNHGYRIQRLAKDVFELIDRLELVEPDILAHSMGAAVIWSYLLLFGAEKPPRRLIFIDEPRALLARPDWPENVREEAGAIIPTFEALCDLVARVRTADTTRAVADLLRPMFTKTTSDRELLEIAEQNLQFPRTHAADLIAENCVHDWRAVIERICQPTLVFGGEASIHPSASQRWIARTVPGAELDIFPSDQGGCHFLFHENPRRFNERTVRFLTS